MFAMYQNYPLALKLEVQLQFISNELGPQGVLTKCACSLHNRPSTHFLTKCTQAYA